MHEIEMSKKMLGLHATYLPSLQNCSEIKNINKSTQSVLLDLNEQPRRHCGQVSLMVIYNFCLTQVLCSDTSGFSNIRTFYSELYTPSRG